MADKDKAKVDLGLLEEDDEFEEFPAEGKLKKNQALTRINNNDLHFFTLINF